MEISLSADLADRLDAAVEARTVIHFDVCTVYSEGPEYGCSCGVPALLAELRDLLAADRVPARQGACATPTL